MIIYLIVGIVLVLTISYFLLMIFFPEWVGISGEDTEKAVDAHRQEPNDSDKKIE